MKLHSYPNKFRPKSFSIRIHMAHITHKTGIYILGDWLEPLPLGDVNIMAATTMVITLECHVTASGKVRTFFPKNIT